MPTRRAEEDLRRWNCAGEYHPASNPCLERRFHSEDEIFFADGYFRRPRSNLVIEQNLIGSGSDFREFKGSIGFYFCGHGLAFVFDGRESDQLWRSGTKIQLNDFAPNPDAHAGTHVGQIGVSHGYGEV